MVELDGSGAAPLEAEDPRRIGEIALAGRLGAGGMGRVFLGVSEGRYVAVKQLLASVVGEDEDFVRRFGHELDNLARLPAEATAPLLASDRTARPPWFATAYVPGLTLREALDVHGGPLPAPSLWRLLREAAASLAPVHALDMVHRDLKPSNVMLTLDGLTLIDFGVARAAEQSRLTRTGMVVGTPAYMAPEQASGARGLSGATDVFALGSVLAYAACGRPPFGEESGHGVLYRIVHEEPGLEPLRELDAELAELVGACLAKDPGDRPGAAELLERASRHVPEGGPLWPEAVTGRLSERAAFAERVQEVDVPTLPLGGKGPGTPEPEPEPKAKPEPEPAQAEPAQAEPVQAAGSGGGEPARRGRRARVLLAVVPVVVVASGTTLAIQNLPFASAPPSKAEAGAAPQGSGAASVPAPGGPSAPASASASAPAPGATPSGPPSPGAPSPGGQAPGGTGQGAAGAPQGGGPGPAPGTGPGTGTGPAPGTGNAAGGANPSGGGGSTPAPPPPATGAGRYRNGNNGECITQVFGASDSGDCGDGSARWAVRSRPDGSFKLVNEQSGQCLYSNGPNQAVFVGDCAQDVGRLWRSGPGGTLRDSAGACLDLGFGGGLNTASCDGDASQRWSRQS